MTKTAFEYGRLAYKNHISAPSRHKEFLDAHLTGAVIGEGIAPLVEWQKGWQAAQAEQMAMPVFELTLANGKQIYAIARDLPDALYVAGCSESDIQSYDIL